ncbi:MAG TPA: PilZ domain-containing protein [Pseudomonadales bacterium]|nr:PilZ domain-containing protein [Pseudomonadales bacterium]
MSNSDVDRRELFRLKDTIQLRVRRVAEGTVSKNPYAEHFDVPAQLALVSELHHIDTEASNALKHVGESNRQLSNYLRATSKKIDILARYVLRTVGAQVGESCNVIISEGGITFWSKENFPIGAQLHLSMLLFPSLTGLAAIARVTNSKEENGSHLIGVVFETMLENDRQQLSRHIMHKQSLMIRERQGKSN